MPPDVDVARLRADVDGMSWYHTLELGHGIVTPGEYDLRATAARLPIPETLSGQRCLDVGTHDGFWAFEMERRGGSVVAIDLDDPAALDWPEPRPHMDQSFHDAQAARRRAFSIAHDARGSTVDRRDLSVYDLSIDEVGQFDFAFIGTLLHHLRDPVLALTAIRRVVTGRLLVCGVFAVGKTMLYPKTPVVELYPGQRVFWNNPNRAGLKEQIERGGWSIVSVGTPFLEHWGPGRPERTPLLERPWRQLPRRVLYRFGIPHIWVLAEPRPSA